MQKIAARAGQLVRWNARTGTRYVQTAHFSLPADLERRFGSIYAIISVDASPRAGEALFAHIEDSFGRGALEAARRCSGDATHELLFETAINQVNHAVTRALGERGLGIEPELVSAALVAVRDRSVVSAIWGRPSVLLYHPTSQGLRAYDLIDDQPALGARRAFGSVIAGEIGEHDRLLLATQDVRDILGVESVERAMAAAEPAMASKLLRDGLAPIEEELTIALLALDVAPVRYLEDLERGRTVTTQSSLADLRRVESRTEDILSPSPLATIQKTVAHAAAAVRAKHLKADETVPARVEQVIASPDPESPTASSNPRREISVSAVMVKALTGLFRGLWSGIKALATTDWPTLPARTAAAIDRAAGNLVHRFNGLAPLRKKLLLGIMFAVLALNSTVLVGDWKARIDEVATASERRVLAIKQKIDSAEASLIYRDEMRAKLLIEEAATETAALPSKKDKDAAAKSDLEARIASARATMRRAVALSAPQIVSTVNVAGAETPSLTRLSTAGGALWGVSSKGELFRISPVDGAAQKSGDLADAPAVVLPIGDSVLAATGSGSATLAPASGSGAGKSVRIDMQGGTIADADTWNGRLYVLDAAHNRIIRAAADALGYGAPTFYLKDGTDVTRGVSIVIDSAVWVLSSDGQIALLNKGEREPFAAASVEPAITAAKRIRTTPDSKSLFVLDTAPVRIIRFDKATGALIAQYESPSLAGATDFTVDEAGKTLLVTVGNQVLKFGLPE